VDALYEKIRDNHRIVNMAIQVVIGIDEQGRRDILAIQPMPEESETTLITSSPDAPGMYSW